PVGHEAPRCAQRATRPARSRARDRQTHEARPEGEVSRGEPVIAASALGADAAASSISPEALPDGLFVLDLALHRAETALMREAQARGGTVANGQVSFLAAQAAAFHLWTGAEPPGDVLREALSSALGSGDREVAVAGD